MPYILSPRAHQHLRTILADLAEYSGQARSLRVEETLLTGFRAIAAAPGIGHLRRDLTSGEFLFHYAKPYLIVYVRYSLPPQIVGIYHGARDIAALLQRDL